MSMTAHRTRSTIEAEIADKRAKAKRYSLVDPKREALDAECDALVDEWMTAEA